MIPVSRAVRRIVMCVLAVLGPCAVARAQTVGNDDVSDIFGNTAPQAAFVTRTLNATRYRNLDATRSVIGSFDVDTTALTNGSHSLAWGVSDSDGRVDGIGSRNFVVLNSGGDVAAADQVLSSNFEVLTSERTDARQRAVDALATTPAIARGDASSLAGLPIAAGPIWGRTGFDPATARVPVRADAAGVRHIGIPELGRLEILLGGVDARAEAAPSFTGFLVANGTLRDLPAGSHLDPATGVFTWAPGPGFIGTYRLTFLRGGAQIPIDVTVRPTGTVDPTQGEVRMFIDLPSGRDVLHGAFTITGWALDPQSAIGSGIDAVNVWAKPVDSDAAASFLGVPVLDGARPDVAAAFGGQFDRTGFRLVASLPAGDYDLIVYAHSARTGRWEDARVVRVTVR